MIEATMSENILGHLGGLSLFYKEFKRIILAVWCLSVISALGRLRQEGPKFKASLDYIAESVSRKKSFNSPIYKIGREIEMSQLLYVGILEFSSSGEQCVTWHHCGKTVNKQSLLFEFSLLLLLTQKWCNAGQLKPDTNTHGARVKLRTKTLCVASRSFVIVR